MIANERTDETWVPRELVWHQGRPVVCLVPLGGRPRAPFWEDDLKRAHGRPRLVPLDAVEDAPLGWRPAGFVFHMMRCGSTAVARLLGALPRNRVISEPMIFQALLAGPPVDRVDLVRWTRRLLFLHVAAGGGGNLYVKWSSAMSCFIDVLEESFPGVPSVFVHREPVEVLVSCVVGPPRHARKLTRDLFAAHLCPTREVLALPLGELLARYIGTCCHRMARAREIRLVDYRRLPELVWRELDVHFKLGLDQSEEEQLRRLAGFYSKDETFAVPWQDDSAAKQAQATEQIREWSRRYAEPELRRLLETQPSL